jgi:hypothetical protein
MAGVPSGESGLTDALYNMPRHGYTTAQEGLAQVAGAGLPPVKGEKPLPPGRARAAGVSKMIRGTGEAVTPVALPVGLALAPAPTIAGLAAGYGAGTGTEWGLNKLGVAPEYSQLGGDIAGWLGGGKAAGWAENPQAAFEQLRGIPGGVANAARTTNDWINQAFAHAGYDIENPERGSVRIGQKPLGDVKRRTMEDLDQRIPEQVRAVSPDPTRTLAGQPFHSLDLNQPGEGFLPLRELGSKAANQTIQQMWHDAVNESEAGGGTTAAKAVQQTGARPPDAQFWDDSFSLPQRARYWYELSGESFTGKHVDLPPEMQPAFIDAVAGTSGGVEPRPNLQRAIGIASENLQNTPVMTDLRDPVSARNALNPEEKNLQSLKYGSFSGTMQYTSGLSPKPPLTTNDVQVAKMFGIKGSDIGKNPVLYEVLSRFFLKMRDAQNQELAPGAQPWETWQMQAPAWVNQRIIDNPAKASQYDDYSQVFPGIIQKLANAGVPTPGGRITTDTLLDPRTPDLMSGTRQQFLGTPVATAEVASKLTPQGSQAADLYGQLQQLDPGISWVQKAKARYLQIQRNMMQDLAMRTKTPDGKEVPSVISQLMSEIAGRKVDVSRLDWNGYGTFEGEMNPNLRIPMTGRASSGEWINLDKPQREAFLATLGADTQQAAMAASHFEAVPHGGTPDTYSVWLNRYDGVVDHQAITNFSKQIGYPVNVSQYPNGVLVDVNIGGFDTRPTLEQVRNAAKGTFGSDPSVKDVGIVARKYDSDYVDGSDYGRIINEYQRAKRATAAQPGRPGGVRAAAPQRGNLAGVRKTIQKISRGRDQEFADWTATNQANLQKHLSSQPTPPSAPPSPPPGGFARGGLASIRRRGPPFYGGLASAAA